MTTHLFVRSSYSFLESPIRITQMVQKAKQMGYSAVALCDHNVLFGFPSFQQACEKEGIHPIYGLEIDILYHDKIQPFVLVAKDQIGYKQLIHFSSQYNASKIMPFEEFYPNTNHCTVIVNGHDGLFEGVYHPNSEQTLKEYLLELKEHLNDFYMGISMNDFQQYAENNKYLKQICSMFDIPTVALHKVLYLEKEEASLHKVLRCIKYQRRYDESDSNTTLINGRYFLSPSEMLQLYGEEDCRNSDKIAQSCQCDIKQVLSTMPKYDLQYCDNSTEELKKLILEGLNKRLNNQVPQAYKERIRQEFQTIHSMHFEDYFLIVQDFIRAAKEKGILIGPGRGSAVSSLVSYALGITDIDPMPYHLLFERFLNPERITMPDIDTDIPDNRRQEVIDYMVQKYGSQHVAGIVTFSTLAARQVLRDVAKVFGIQNVESILNRIRSKDTLQLALDKSQILQEMLESSKDYQRLFEVAMKLEGLPRQSGTHPAGIVLSAIPFQECIPTIQIEDTLSASQYTSEFLEQQGLLKMDFLGLRNLTILTEIVSEVKQKRPDFDIQQIPFDDAKTISIFAKQDTTGIFQFESEGIRHLLKEIEPKTFEDIVIAVALYRPGPMENIPLYLENRKHPEKIRYVSEEVKPILEETSGVMIFQEQVQRVTQILAGFSLGKADILRRAMSKKNTKEMESLKNDFFKGCRQKGYSDDQIVELFDYIEKFAGYGFNKAHAVAYAYLAYQLAYLKANYPYEFYKALLNSVIGDKLKTAQYIAECRQKKIHVLYPHVQKSRCNYSYEVDGLRLPLSVISGIGVSLEERILQERKKKQFIDFFDFVARMKNAKIQRDEIIQLIHAGACDEMGYSRTTLEEYLDQAISYADLIRIDGHEDTMYNTGIVSKPVFVNYKDDPTRCIENEKDAMGFYLGPHPIIEVRNKHMIHLPTLAQIKRQKDYVQGFAYIQSIREYQTKKGEPMCYVTLSDETDELSLMVMGNNLRKDKAKLTIGNYVIFHGKMTEDQKCFEQSIQVIQMKENR